MNDDIFIAEGVKLVGDVSIGMGSSLWYNSVLRADLDSISIGEHSNVQDNCSVHLDRGFPVVIGDYVSIGHNAIVHGCTICDNVLVGMGATILDGANIGENSIIGANALFTENMIVPPSSLVVGLPGKVIRKLTNDEIKAVKDNAIHYEYMWRNYKYV